VRARAACAAAALGALACAAPAAAHPLGNFSVNHLSRVSVSSERVEVLYVLDEAEIPTFQQRALPRDALVARVRAEVRRELALRVDGRRVPLAPASEPRLSFPPGQGGLRTTRLELRLVAPAHGARRVELRDGTWAGRQGWRAIVPVPGRGTEVRSGVPSADPTRGLRTYPVELLRSPPDQRAASFAVRAGAGTVVAPRADGSGLVTTRAASSGGGGGDGFADVFERAAAGETLLPLLLLAAFAWGAFHALSPGHGKAMVAAYLVGTRGTARDAVALGATVTVTHTAGVFALGLVTLGLTAYVVPEDLYPWLSLVSGLLVVGVGVGLLRSRVRSLRARPGGDHRHHHGHDHSHSHDHHGHGHHHRHGHDHAHEHPHPPAGGRRGLLALGVSAGLLPCPSALVVLLAALSQHEVGLGLLLIVAFSLGLAGTLTGLGVLVVSARALTPRLARAGRALTVLPALSTLLILAVGVLLTAQALPSVI
jgi:ABC-type nickel/cobalt efflux system permease component RcnA